MSIAKNIPDNIKRVARSVGYALYLDNADDWHGLPLILRQHLTVKDRASLAFMALRAMDRDDAVQTAEAALTREAGQPIAPLFDHMDAAAHWADMASTGELKVYALASFNRLSPGNRAAFLDYVQGRAAA